MGLFANGSSSVGAGSRSTSWLMTDLESEYDRSKSPDKDRRRRKSQDLSNANIDLLTSKVTGYRNSKRGDSDRESCGPRSVKTVQASNSRRESRSVSVSRNRSRSPSLSRRASRSTTPRKPRSSGSQRDGRSTTTRRSKNSSSQRDGRSTTPKSMRTTVIASGSQRNSRSTIPTTIVALSPTASRSRSAEPSYRKSRSVDVGIDKSRSRSVEPAQNIRQSKSTDAATTRSSKSKMSRSRSADPLRIKTEETLKEKVTRFARSLSPSNANAKSSSKSAKSASNSSQTPSKSSMSSKEIRNRHTNLIKCVPFGLEKDMTYLADGMNLDKNMRYFLAAFDASKLEDFYLMSDSDFSALVQRAKASNRSIPPLQLRKVQMLRRWLKEVVDDHVIDNEEISGGVRRRGRKVELIPKDWKEQYRNDLPHLKLQLRHQSESIYEKIRNISETLGCGASMLY